MSDYAQTSGLPPVGDGDARAATWMREARLAFQRADPQRALYAAREVLAVDGSNAEAWSIRARASFALEHYDDAEFEGREAVRLAPHVGTTHEILATVLEVKHRFSEAMSEIDEAIRLDPTERMNRMVRASILLSSGQAHDAAEAFARLTEEDPDEALYRRYLADALYDEAEGQLTQIPGDRHAVTSVEQIALVRMNTDRALALDFDDTDLRDSLRALQAQALYAEQKRWSRPDHPLAYFIAACVSLAASFMIFAGVQAVLLGLLGIVILVGVVWLFVNRHYRPGWQYNAETALQSIRRG